ncbi:hypothetical protein GCM10027562_29200 [Arthrobacter pigmenti]
MTVGVCKEERIERLRKVRAQDSVDKTKRSLESITALQDEGVRVSFAAVARAVVSTWFVYNKSEVATRIRAAIADQSEHGLDIAKTPKIQRVSAAALQAELAFARKELAAVRLERNELRTRVALALGDAIDSENMDCLRAKVQQLEAANNRQASEVLAANRHANGLSQQLRETEDELIAARASLRRSIRAVPSPS